MSHRVRRIVITATVLALLLVALTARRTAIDVLFHRIELAPPDTVLSTIAGNDSIPVFAINIDPETNATGIIDVTPPPPPKPAPVDTATVRPEKPHEEPKPDLNLDDVLDEAAGPRGSTSATDVAPVPPRPIEITWPETRQLKQCIGQSANVRILVSEQGKVKDAKIVPSGVLPACADAALSAARHIRFEPGRQGGVPVEMWTEVRIDFQKRD
jgi:TonB family protein